MLFKARQGALVNFCWVCSAGLSDPLPHYRQYILWSVIDPILVAFWPGQICDFHDPNLVTFYFYELTLFRLNEEHFTFHLSVQTFWYIC